MAKPPDQPTRRLILDFVATHPGASAREIQRSLSLGWGETAYHLEQLIQASALKRSRAGRRDYFFPANFSSEDRRVLIAFQSATERILLLTLSREPEQSFTDLMNHLRMSKSHLSLHLRFLLASGLVGLSADSGVRRYHAEQPVRVLELYRIYRETWGDRWIDKFTAAFSGIMRP
jgi:predicted transcriptional regulator